MNIAVKRPAIVLLGLLTALVMTLSACGGGSSSTGGGSSGGNMAGTADNNGTGTQPQPTMVNGY